MVRSASRDRNLQRLLAAVGDWTVWPYDCAAAQQFGRIAAELRRSGRPIGQIDMQIAAVARTVPHCTVVSSDADLAAVTGLPIENWETP